MSDLPLCLGVLKHRAPLAKGGGHLSAKNIFAMEFLLMWCNFKFEGVLFRSDSRHNDGVDSPEHVCLTACLDLPGLPPSRPT